MEEEIELSDCIPDEFLDAGNFTIDDVVTPIKIEVYQQLLRQSSFDQEKAQYLISGFKNGFDIGYRGPLNRTDLSKNIPITVGSESDIWSKLMKEVKLGRHASPFKKIPYKNFMQSPIGLVPKAGNQTRLIFHLSFDFGGSDEEDRKSLNFHTPDELCTVKYKDLDFAVHSILRIIADCDREDDCPALYDEDVLDSEMDGNEESKVVVNHNQQYGGSDLAINQFIGIDGKPAQTIYMSKSDLKSAFKILPILPSQRKFLIMKARYPENGQYYFFIEKCLPFGASVSCARFQLFSESLRHITEFVLRRRFANFSITNYLDDYLFSTIDPNVCDEMVRTFLAICDDIGCPVSLDKTEWSTTQIVFLGILLDGENHRLCVPQEKQLKAKNLLQWAISKRKVTIKFIERLTGTLNFLVKAIVPSRTFIRGMYSKIHLKDAQGRDLKPFHHISLNKEFIGDCLIWQKFLELGATDSRLVCRPFIDVNKFTHAKILNFYSDTSMHGMGAIFGTRWLYCKWDKQFLELEKPTIEYLELFALVSAILVWGNNRHLCNTKIVIFCDNQIVREYVNNLTAGNRQCLKLLRILALDNLKFNRRVKIIYVKSKTNVLSDAISRADFTTFWRKVPETMERTSYSMPDAIWPMQKIWYES